MKVTCDITYIGKKYSGSDAGFVASLHESIESELRNLSDGRLISSPMIPYFRTKSKSTEDYNKALRAMNHINNKYEAKVVTVKKDTSGREIFNVNINPIAETQLYHYRDAVQKQMNDPYSERDGEILNKSDYNYEQRVYNLNEDSEQIDEFMQKADKMDQIFSSKGIKTKVILDGDLQASGAVLSSQSVAHKALLAEGSIDADTKVIALNPRNLMKDTVFHEFGHLFIDAIGGTNNQRILAAYNKLIGTLVYNTVKENYPELAEGSDKFMKEVVTTALGQEANAIYESEQSKSWWDRFADWFSDRVQSIFGIQKDEVKELAKTFLDGDFNADFSVQNTIYYQKAEAPLRDKVNVLINKLEDANKQIVSSLSRIITQFERREGKLDFNNLHGNLSEEGKYIVKLNEAKKKFEKLKENDSAQAIAEFINLRNETAATHLKYLEGVNANFDAKNIESIKKQLSLIKAYNDTYVIAERITMSLPYVEGLSDQDRQDLKAVLKDSISLDTFINAEFTAAGNKVLLEEWLPFEDRLFVERKDELSKEFNKATSDSRAGETKEGYIERKINEERPEILERTREYLSNELRQSVSDIGIIELWARSSMNMNSTVIRLTKKMMDQVEFNRDMKFLAIRDEGINLFKEYYTKHGTTDLKKMYSAISDLDDNGIPYITGKYDLKLYNEQRKLYSDIQAAKEEDIVKEKELQDEAGKQGKKKITAHYSVNETKAKRAMNAWRKENFTQIPSIDQPDTMIFLPKPKWQSSKYKDIMSKPDSVEAKLLNFLTDKLKQGEKNLGGKRSLVRSVGEAEYYRFPSMGKETIEKATDGQYKANMKDSIERLMKYRDDDVEVGDINTDGNVKKEDNFFKRTIADQVGQERHVIPIHYRGNFDPKTSTFDLMTAVMSDFYMSTTYYERAKVLPMAELVINSVKEKKINQTEGSDELIKMFRTGDMVMSVKPKDGIESNEYKKLVSEIENRLFGIQTLDKDAKWVETIMGWTGTTMLAMNFYAGIANVMQGQVMNFMEAVGGQFYGIENLNNAEMKYLRDLSGILGDIGSLQDKSRTNMMIDLLDPQGEFTGIKERFMKTNKAKALASQSTLSAPNKLGEHYIQGKLLYAITDNIKVKDKDGNFLDKNLRPTKDKKKAISFDEAIEFKDGKPQLVKEVYSTTFSDQANGDHDLILLETRSLVKKISSDLHGLYDPKLAPHIQRTMVGKAVIMLRKWLVPGFDRRWRGMRNGAMTFDEVSDEDNRHRRFYSGDLKSMQEGTYTTAFRFFNTLRKEGEFMQMLMWSKAPVWDNMSDMERANVKKAVVEFVMIALTFAAAHLLRSLAADLPDDENTHLVLGAFAFRRLHQELFAFINPLEGMKLIASPAASVSMIQKATELLFQAGGDLFYNVPFGDGFEEYQTGRREGTLKIQKKFNDVIPVLSQTNRTALDAMEYVFATSY